MGGTTWPRRLRVLTVALLLLTGCSAGAPGGAPPAGAAKVSEQASAGRQLFAQKGCIACHVAPGVLGATGTIGPNLTGIGDPGKRPTLADGQPNTAEHLKGWIKDPQSLKPGTMMPNLNLSDKEADDLTAFLQTLR